MGDNMQNQQVNVNVPQNDEQMELLQGIIMSMDQEKLQKLIQHQNPQQRAPQQVAAQQQQLNQVGPINEQDPKQQLINPQPLLNQQPIPQVQNQLLHQQNYFRQNFEQRYQQLAANQQQPLIPGEEAPLFGFKVPEQLGYNPYVQQHQLQQPIFVVGNQQQSFRYFSDEEFSDSLSITQNPNAASTIYSYSNSLHAKAFNQNFPTTLEGRVYKNPNLFSETLSSRSLIGNLDQDLEEVDKYREFFHILNLIPECYKFISLQQGLQTMSVACKKPKLVLNAFKNDIIPKLNLFNGITSDRVGNLIKFSQLFSFSQDEVLNAEAGSRFAGGLDNLLNVKYSDYDQFLICFYENENSNHFGLIKKIENSFYFLKYQFTGLIIGNQQQQKQQNQRFGVTMITSNDLVARHFGICNLVYGISAMQENERPIDQNLMNVLRFFYQDLTYEQQNKKWKAFIKFQNPGAAALYQVNSQVKRYFGSNNQQQNDSKNTKQQEDKKKGKAKAQEKSKNQKTKQVAKTSKMVTRNRFNKKNDEDGNSTDAD